MHYQGSKDKLSSYWTVQVLFLALYSLWYMCLFCERNKSVGRVLVRFSGGLGWDAPCSMVKLAQGENFFLNCYLYLLSKEQSNSPKKEKK